MTRDRDLFGFDPAPDQDRDEVTLTLIVHGDVGINAKISETDDGRTLLLPHSQITISPTGKTTSRVGHPKYPICEITMPRWLALDRGLI
jgi:hypothetical protein